ncbi:MAG: formate--tetrahydrofolate ligase [Actinomycetota bacterium]
MTKTGLEIAQEAKLRPILEVAAEAGLEAGEVEQYGRFRAKVALSVLDRLKDRPDGKIVVVTAITPTKAGEGKTATAIGLAEGLARIGKRSTLCLREPSMGPVFGIKGGGTGAGLAQVLPMEDINLHFTGDIHAITAANNLLAAAIDASVFNDNPLDIEPTSVSWPRALDVNDRALRNMVIGLGGKPHGVPRQAGFVITAASEVMTILSLATDLADLRLRLGRIAVAETRGGQTVTAKDLSTDGAMAVLLKDAVRPNLVQTLEGQPVFIHAGPFGNIATGNSSVISARIASKLSDLVVTEAGFGSELGLEKFCHIVSRENGLRPAVALLVASVRAIKAHGGMAEPQMEDLESLKRGGGNLAAHIDIVHSFGLPCVVGVNRFPTDTGRELAFLRDMAMDMGAEEAIVNESVAKGGAGAEDLARAVVRACERPDGFKTLYRPDTPIQEQVEAIATSVYGAASVEYTLQAQRGIARLHERGLGHLPVCMAKSHLSLSHDPKLRGRPLGFVLPVRDVYASPGAGFVVALCGDIQLMPGLGRDAAYMHIDIDEDGKTVGLF